MAWQAILGGAAAGAGGGLMGLATGGMGQALASGHSRKMWRKWKAWYDSRYRRTVTDLRAAGLNPILATGNLTGPGAPMGSPAAMPTGGSSPWTGLATAGRDIARKEYQLRDATLTTARAQAERADRLREAEAQISEAGADTGRENVRLRRAEAEVAALQAERARLERGILATSVGRKTHRAGVLLRDASGWDVSALPVLGATAGISSVQELVNAFQESAKRHQEKPKKRRLPPQSMKARMEAAKAAKKRRKR